MTLMAWAMLCIHLSNRALCEVRERSLSLFPRNAVTQALQSFCRFSLAYLHQILFKS